MASKRKLKVKESKVSSNNLSKTVKNKTKKHLKLNLNYEKVRLKTFVDWPAYSTMDPSRLVKAGFFYSGTEDEVICFSCKGHLKNWSYGDVAIKKHADAYPHCDFIKNGSNNVSFLDALISKSLRQKKVDCLKGYRLGDGSVDFTKLKTEAERLKTFSGGWPPENGPVSFISKFDLAKAGFFYTGTKDEVQCPFCKSKISNWKPKDIPFVEHLERFPSCDYVACCITEMNVSES